MAAPKRIWIDTDCALGAETFLPRDVDDGYALAAVIRAAQHEPDRFEILGISVTAGNVDAPSAHACVKRLLVMLDATAITVVDRADAARAIAAIDGAFALLALGPLTNPANALALRADLAQRATLSSVGTVLDGRNWRRRLSDLNISRDRSAARCLGAFTTSFVFPLDVVERLVLDRRRLAALESSVPRGATLARHSRRWLHWSFAKHGAFRFPLWDLVAALHAIDRLADPRWDSQNRLTGFVAQESWNNFLQLL